MIRPAMSLRCFAAERLPESSFWIGDGRFTVDGSRYTVHGSRFREKKINRDLTKASSKFMISSPSFPRSRVGMHTCKKWIQLTAESFIPVLRPVCVTTQERGNEKKTYDLKPESRKHEETYRISNPATKDVIPAVAKRRAGIQEAI